MSFSRSSLESCRERLLQEHWGANGGGDVVSVEQQLLFQRFYLQQMGLMNAHLLKLPNRVQATACHYFKKFYTVHSINQHHPKYVMLTALFLACKVEESRLDAATICRRAEKPSWDKPVLELEVPMLQALQFHLSYPHPHVAALGWLNHLQLLFFLEPPSEALSPTSLQLKQNVYSTIDALMMTDASLLFPAPVIAMCAVQKNCPPEEAKRVEDFFRQFFGAEKYDADKPVLDALLEETANPVVRDQVAPVEKTLSAWIKAREKKEKKEKKKQEEKKKTKKSSSSSSSSSSKKRGPEEMEQKVEETKPAVEAVGEFEIKTTMKRVKQEDESNV